MNPAVTSSKATLVDLAEDDLGELAGFVAAQSGRASDETFKHLTWLLLDNPARREGFPLGCGVRSRDGALVGCILYLPQMFVFKRSPLLMLGSSCFYVDALHRGSGGALFLKCTRAASTSPLFGNSANAIAAQLWKARGASPIPDSDHELLGVVHWPPVIEDLAARGGAGETISRAVGTATSWLRHVQRLELPLDPNSELERLESIDDVMDLPLDRPAERLTALRSESYIRWRYLSGRDPSIALFAFRNRQSLREIFVAVNERPRGLRKTIRSLNVLDVFPKVSPASMVAIVAALQERYRNDTDMVVVRCQDTSCQKALIEAGFRRRAFESPNGWLLDRQALLPTQDSYFVPADGDWII
ncbi:MAG: hypothetical protein WA172_08365 [Terriglobales bacterium]